MYCAQIYTVGFMFIFLLFLALKHFGISVLRLVLHDVFLSWGREPVMPTKLQGTPRLYTDMNLAGYNLSCVA